jgi:ribosome-associated toxin RatA of RatAB toxin-antitoxin module
LKVVERSAIVPLRPRKCSALVNDVARYPEFLPWCVGAAVKEIAGTERIASLKSRAACCKTEFTTRNTLQPDRRSSCNSSTGRFAT